MRQIQSALNNLGQSSVVEVKDCAESKVQGDKDAQRCPVRGTVLSNTLRCTVTKKRRRGEGVIQKSLNSQLEDRNASF